MDEATLAKVVDGVYKGEYSLLLGAGASIGSLGGNGEPLPSGPRLRDMLVEQFKIRTEGQPITLSRAYAAAKRNSPIRLEKFIRNHFTRCQPDWQQILTRPDWHRIWTLNIDDVIEVAYDQRNIEVERFNWTSKFRDGSGPKQQIIHLHGFANDVSDPSESASDVVFSVAEYATILKDSRAWHTVFTDEFAERPFIILGASLVDEFDLQQALASSAAVSTRGFPTIIILKRISQLERDELQDLGLIVIEGDARKFMELLHEKLSNYRSTVQGFYKQILNPQVARFLQQFTDLRQFDPHSGTATRNFYSGYEPHWKNILDKDDAPMQTTERSFNTIQRRSAQNDQRQTIHVLTGSRGSGKSTGLLRIARYLISDGLPVFHFRGDEDLDTHATMEWLRHLPETVMIFDDCADFADSIGELAEMCAESELKLLIVGAERSTRRNFLLQNIDHNYLQLRPEYEYDRLSNRDIGSLIDKLSSRRRLGQITRRSRSQQYRYFRSQASRRLFEGMANLEGGQGFRARIQTDYQGISSQGLLRLYAAASIAYQYGYSVPLGISSKIAEMSAKELQRSLNTNEQDLMFIGSDGVRLPHRITAALVVESALSGDYRFEALRRLTLALAPHIDIRAIRARTRPYRLLQPLMDQENVFRLVGTTRGRQLYELLQDAYDWNGRYWEQRALFESSLGNHAQARSYAEHSLQLHRHPFAFNTLGTVLGRIALKTGDAGTLREAVDNLNRSRDERRWEASEHPYITFFNMMIGFGKEWDISSIPMPLRSAFNEWLRLARISKVFLSADQEVRLQEFQRDWLYLATDQ